MQYFLTVRQYKILRYIYKNKIVIIHDLFKKFSLTYESWLEESLPIEKYIEFQQNYDSYENSSIRLTDDGIKATESRRQDNLDKYITRGLAICSLILSICNFILLFTK